MSGDSTTMTVAGSIFTEQFLMFLSAVQIAINNDIHLKARVVLAFSDLQDFFGNKELSPGQIIAILSAFISNIMRENQITSMLDGADSFL